MFACKNACSKPVCLISQSSAGAEVGEKGFLDLAESLGDEMTLVFFTLPLLDDLPLCRSSSFPRLACRQNVSLDLTSHLLLGCPSPLLLPLSIIVTQATSELPGGCWAPRLGSLPVPPTSSASLTLP